MLPYAPYLKPCARRLRCDMTDAEQRLWSRMRRRQLHGVQVYRQKPLGRWIVDFCVPAARLVVEVDGAQHIDAAGVAADAVRDAALRRMGFSVLRFDDRQVLLETDAMVEVIWNAIGARVGSR